MSTATAAANVADAPPPKGKKKLIIIIAAVLLVVVLGGVGAVVMLKKKAAAAEGADEGAPAKAAEAKHEPEAAPIFVPLDPFTVNLADRDAERYAQVGLTLEVTDPHLVEEIKTFMPAIRNNVLMTIADRTAGDLMSREGKAKLAEKIRRETSRALGFDVPADDDGAAASGDGGDSHGKGAGKKKSKAEDLPIKAVQFSNFIIQ